VADATGGVVGGSQVEVVFRELIPSIPKANPDVPKANWKILHMASPLPNKGAKV